LSENNKEFFHTRFSLSEDPLESYKRIIQDSVHPYLEGNEILDIGSAEDAIERYSKAIDDVKGETELMVFFVECGNNFTLSYGDIDDDFYDSVLLMYEKAIQNVTELSPKEQKIFGIITKKKVTLCPDLTIRCGNIFSKNRRRYHECRAT